MFLIGHMTLLSGRLCWTVLAESFCEDAQERAGRVTALGPEDAKDPFISGI